jgi:hypothetical protein
MKKYLKGLRAAFGDADFMAIEFLLTFILFELAMLVALGIEEIIYRAVVR